MLVTLLTLAVLLLWDASDLDLPLERWFGNANGFPWRHHWLSEGLLHNGLCWALSSLSHHLWASRRPMG